MQSNFKDKVFHIIRKRNLCSYMNNTKWTELISAVKNEMPFPPAFSIKYLTQETVTQNDDIGTEDVYYWGDWDGENFPTQEFYFNIEWIKVRPRYLKHIGKLTASELVDGSKIFEEILYKYNIPYDEKDGLYCIYGYR